MCRLKKCRALITKFVVIIPVTREVSFRGFLFKVTTFMLELYNFIIKPRDLWTIYHNPCFKRGMLVKMSVRVMLKQSESASMLSQCTLAQSIEEAPRLDLPL